MMGQDWDTVTIDKRGRRGAGESKSAAEARAGRAGGLVAEKRFDGGSNPAGRGAAAAGAGMSAKKLDEDTEHFTHATVDHSLSLAIQKARLDKKLTQRELALAIAEKPTIIGEYESGRAIPNPTLISKLERALGVRLPRPPKVKK